MGPHCMCPCHIQQSLRRNGMQLVHPALLLHQAERGTQTPSTTTRVDRPTCLLCLPPTPPPTTHAGKTYFMLKPSTTTSFTSSNLKKHLYDTNGRSLVDLDKKMISLHGTWMLTRSADGSRIAEVKPSRKSELVRRWGLWGGRPGCHCCQYAVVPLVPVCHTYEWLLAAPAVVAVDVAVCQ